MTDPYEDVEDIIAAERVADSRGDKIRSDAMYLKLLLDSQALKPDWTARVVARLNDTVRDFPELFPEQEKKT